MLFTPSAAHMQACFRSEAENNASDRQKAMNSPDSENSSSSGTSEHCLTTRASNPANQKVEPLYASASNPIEKTSSAQTNIGLPVKGIVYKYETPSVNSFQTFSSSNHLNQTLEHQASTNVATNCEKLADDSGIGEVSLRIFM